jgi:predicted unusual protein kinase regulating ubiquinone biosynthesis (AarF/ABC1/UbiB family)
LEQIEQKWEITALPLIEKEQAGEATKNFKLPSLKKLKQQDRKITLKERRKIIIKLFRWLVTDTVYEKAQTGILGKKWAEKQKVARNRARAVRFRETAIELGGVLIKLGQYLSARFDVTPPEWIEELSKLQDSVPSVDFAELKPVIEQDLGGTLEELFETIDPNPLASASLGQVHEAYTKDGRHIAVKVLRPGIQAIIEADLEAMNRVVEFLSRRTDLGKLADLRGIMKEFERTLRRELDYIKEAESAKIIKGNLRDLKYVYVPQVMSDYSSMRVLSTEFIEGVKVSNIEAIEAAGIDRDRAGRILANCYLNQILLDGFFHADPHPGNLFLRKDPDGNVQVVFIDFGMVGEITPTMKSGLRRMVYGVMYRNTDQVIEAMRELNFLREGESVDRLRVAVSFFVDKVLGLDLAQLRDTNFRVVFDEISYVIYNNPLYLPADFSFMSRAVETLIGVCTRLSPKLNFTEETKPFLKYIIEEETGFSPSGSTNGTNGSQVENILNSEFGKELRNLGLEILAIPKNINSVLSRLNNGSSQEKILQEELKRVKDRQERTEKVMTGVVASSVIISGAVIASALRRKNSNGNSKD